jgi:hypothetical protein
VNAMELPVRANHVEKSGEEVSTNLSAFAS